MGRPENVDVRNALKELSEQHGGLTAEIVLEAATNVDSPLHNSFVWDDTEAARQWRLHQARVLIASYTVVVQAAPEGPYNKVREWTHVVSEKKYVPTVVQMEKPGNEQTVAKKIMDTIGTIISTNAVYFEKYPKLGEIEPLLHSLYDALYEVAETEIETAV